MEPQGSRWNKAQLGEIFMSGIKTPAVESYSDLRELIKLHQIREKALRNKECFMKLHIPSADCWCRKAGPGETDLPCP